MKLFVKHFSELTARELYEIYKLRVSVFVVEQKCYGKRRCGLGSKIVAEAIDTAKEKLRADKITIEAQTYVKKMYEDFGFYQTSEEFLEDGIPHVQMQLDLTK